MNPTACKRLFSLGCVAHTEGAVFQMAKRAEEQQAALHPRAVDTVIDPHATIVGMYTSA